MYKLKLPVLLVSLMLISSSCGKKKKPSLSGDEKVEVSDFISSFSLQEAPFQLSDSILKKRDNDSAIISKKILTQFIPDSVMDNFMGKATKYKTYPLGRVVLNDGVNYLFLKTVAGDKRSILLAAFNKNDQFITGMAALKQDDNNNTFQSVLIDKRESITKIITQKNQDGSISEGKDVFVLNVEGKSFTLIMTDPLGENLTELINPIDTLPSKHKYAADYAAGKMNLISIRDAEKPDRINFFIHFEKNNGQCTGEIKGEAFWKSDTEAEYKEDGESCILKLSFSSSDVKIKEESCGSKRSSIDCTFDGGFTKIKSKKSNSPNSKPTANVSKTVRK